MRIASFVALLAVVPCLSGSSLPEEPIKVSVCQLKIDPASFNHKRVEVTGFVSHGFENFTLFDATCSSSQNIWLEYGGKRNSNTVYCCGTAANSRRKSVLEVEKLPVPLNEDKVFRAFDRLINRPSDSTVDATRIHATLVGRFFSGEQQKFGNTISWGGYGHLGCCSLLVIEQVISVKADH